MSKHRRVAKARIKSNKVDHTFELTEALLNNGYAQLEGPKRKKWSKHDIKIIKPLTQTQEDFFHAYYTGYHLVGYGSAGVGKSFLSLYLALNDVLDPNKPQDRIIIVRSNVATRDVGHLPGTIEEKLAPFEAPYRDILESLVGRSSTYEDMKAAGLIQFMPTSYIRGQTWDNAIVIVDESQSQNAHELNSVITRIGEDTRLIVIGDVRQDDLIYKKNDTSGFSQVLKVFETMESVAMIKFTQADIVRSGFVREWIIACESLGF
jgi:phosphate starvation-inducible protein PhoH